MARTTIPEHLQVVLDFVNTLDVESDTDELDSPKALAAWLSGRVQARRMGRLDQADLASAVRLREALRALMLANNGADIDAAASDELERIARRGELQVQFMTDGRARLATATEGLDGALAELLVPVARAMEDGSWERMKACRADTCHWAFYDRSRNRSGTWCEMAVCGNRTKVRAYRARTSGAPGA
jgi:predicted RNA-binding Zn ribbon-like protein